MSTENARLAWIQANLLGLYPLMLGLSFFLALLLTSLLIPVLRRLNAGQVIQEDGPEAHQSKAGTPTMGGLAIVASALIIAWTFPYPDLGTPGNVRLVLGAVTVLMAAYALIGAADDWLTVRPRNGRRGLTSKVKFGAQFVVATAFILYLWAAGELHPAVQIPGLTFDLGWAYGPIAVLFITGMANFVNITDGLDGLAAGLTVILTLTLAAAAGIAGAGQAYPQLVLLLCPLAGAALAFLWFNFNPAKVFMGDTGSLAIGAAIPALAIVMKLEILMIVAGMVFILEGLSSALQWAVFKYTRVRTGAGKRVFKMSPLHHHFELSGWAEQSVVVRFWIAGVLFAAYALSAVALSPR